MDWFRDNGDMVWFSVLCLQMFLLDNCMVDNLSLPRNVCKANIILVRRRHLPSYKGLEALENNQCSDSSSLVSFLLYSQINNAKKLYLHNESLPPELPSRTKVPPLDEGVVQPTVFAFFPCSTPNRSHGVAISPMLLHTCIYLYLSDLGTSNLNSQYWNTPFILKFVW